MLVKCSGIEYERTVSKFRKKEENFRVVFTYSIPRARKNWEVSCRSRTTTAKKCTKKLDARVKLLFC